VSRTLGCTLGQGEVPSGGPGSQAADDGEAAVPTPLAEDFDQHAGGAVEDGRMVLGLRSRIDEATHALELDNAVEVDEGGPQRRNDIEVAARSSARGR
jgi:hypothetical protein